MKRVLLSSLLLTAFSTMPSLMAAPVEWSSYRGPAGNGVTTAPVGKPWSSEGPAQAWKQPATTGFSSIATGSGLACTLMKRDFEGSPMEHVVAWDAATGKELWAAPMNMAKYQGGGDAGAGDNKGGDGPRSTPAVSGGKVYAYGASLDLYCFDAKTGKQVWKKDIAKEYGGKNIDWQNATSPIIEGKNVIVSGGGKGAAFLAFDAGNGSLRWKTGDETITHATPVPAEIHGTRQLIFFTKSGLTSVSADRGDVLWHQDYRFNVSTAASPVVFEDVVYCSAGYDVGSGAYQITKNGRDWSSKELWRKEGNELANHWSTPVVKDGMLYGMFQFKEYGKGAVKCVDIRTGETKWTKEGFGPGNVILSGDSLLGLSDKGELVMISAAPDAYKELARADVLDGKCWSTPTIGAGFIFARSTKEAAAFRIEN